MPFKLPELPYALDALAPHISAETLQYHHGKHHKKYVETLNKLAEGTEYADMPLEEVVRKAPPGKIFNNAAQHWNHSFYWQCLSPKGGGEPSGKLADRLQKDFGSIAELRKRFDAAAVDAFGSAWTWLVRDRSGALSIQWTGNADDPPRHDSAALLTCDMWEHAYYIDYRNEKEKYLAAFWKVVNWEFVAAQL